MLDRVPERLLSFRLQTPHHSVTHKPVLSPKLLSLPNTYMKNEGSGDVTGFKFENRLVLNLVVQRKGLR